MQSMRKSKDIIGAPREEFGRAQQLVGGLEREIFGTLGKVLHGALG